MNIKPIRHGEIVLQPVKKLPAGKTVKHNSFIVGHSETGHHHVLEAVEGFSVLEATDNSIWLEILKPAKLVHRKTVDKHKTLPVAPGKYHVIYKNEYDPFTKVIRRVQD